MALLTPEMLAHLKAHQRLFDEHQLENDADIEEYFNDYEDEDGPGSVYVYLCADLELEPIPPYGEPQVTWTLPVSDAELLWDFLHHHRPGGHQHVHDSLLEAIQEAKKA